MNTYTHMGYDRKFKYHTEGCKALLRTTEQATAISDTVSVLASACALYVLFAGRLCKENFSSMNKQRFFVCALCYMLVVCFWYVFAKMIITFLH